MITSPLDYVMFYADRGWKVFPIKAHDKTPLFPAAHEKGNPCKGECGEVGHGFHDATFDVFTLGEWWSKYPNANIGLATGSGSGFMVLDVDPVHDGEKTFQEHVTKYGPMPTTPVSKTGSGGHHYLFNMPDLDVRNSAGKLGSGLDTRGNGGYIVAPFSIHPNGNPYQWEQKPSTTKLADAPDWILRKLFEKKEQAVTGTPNNNALIAGQRNSALTSLAGSMQRRGMSQDAIFVALNAENLNRCIPPLPEDEVKAIVLSVSRYTPQAAPNYQSRDRVTAEWSFCKTIYESPDYWQDFQNIQPDHFADEKLRQYWTGVLSGISVTQAATQAGILTELEKYNDWALPRVDDYARTIKHFSHMALISAYGWRLQKSAEEGDHEKIDRVIADLNSIPPQTGHVVESVTDVADEVEKFIKMRAENPVDVWGIPYAWNRISQHTGGKQTGELVLLAGEPKIGKSFWKLQDVLHTAVDCEVGVWYWCGEMKRTQLMRRFYSLLGVNSRNMKTGHMTEQDWDALHDAKALILNSPLYIDDKSMALHEIRPILARMKSEYGIKEFVIDYAKLVQAPGRDEIEQTGNVSVELKAICRDLDLAGTMIASVNKQGMDNRNIVSKSNVRGSGQQIHDADVIYQLTTFPEKFGMEYGIDPKDYASCVALNISGGREFESILEGGFIPYRRCDNSPKFKELEKVR